MLVLRNSCTHVYLLCSKMKNSSSDTRKNIFYCAEFIFWPNVVAMLTSGLVTRAGPNISGGDAGFVFISRPTQSPNNKVNIKLQPSNSSPLPSAQTKYTEAILSRQKLGALLNLNFGFPSFMIVGDAPCDDSECDCVMRAWQRAPVSPRYRALVSILEIASRHAACTPLSPGRPVLSIPSPGSTRVKAKQNSTSARI